MADPDRRDGDDAVRREEVGARAGTGATDAAGAVSVAPERDPDGGSSPVAAGDRRRRSPALGVVVAMLGTWVVVSAVVFDAGAAATWNAVVVGATVVLGAGYDAYRVANDVPSSAGVGALVALLGLWLVVAAAVAAGAFAWSTGVSGLLIAGLAGYAARAAREARPVTGDVRTR